MKAYLGCLNNCYDNDNSNEFNRHFRFIDRVCCE